MIFYTLLTYFPHIDRNNIVLTAMILYVIIYIAASELQEEWYTIAILSSVALIDCMLLYGDAAKERAKNIIAKLNVSIVSVKDVIELGRNAAKNLVDAKVKAFHESANKIETAVKNLFNIQEKKNRKKKKHNKKKVRFAKVINITNSNHGRKKINISTASMKILYLWEA